MSIVMHLIEQKIIQKNNNFNIIRLTAAILVLFSHSYPISGAQGEFFASTWGIDTGGGIGVSIFFILSGFLVTRSLTYSGSVRKYIWSRFLRIFPALIVVILLTVFIFGPVNSDQTWRQYFSYPETYNYIKNIFLFPLHYSLPGVFVGNPMSSVNGSLWTLPVEIIMYSILLLLYSTIRLNKVTAIFVFSLFFIGYVTASYYYQLNWDNQGANLLPGVDLFIFLKLGLPFFIGSLTYFFRDYLQIRLDYFWMACFGLLLAPYIKTLGFIIFLFSLTYLVIFIAFMDFDLTKYTSKIGDLSYGMYIYAFPVQQSLVYYSDKTLSVSELTIYALAITSVFAYLSWHLIEKKMLNYKSFVK
ncbi:MAG: acyltransferase [Gammaproteobacteria bacterium]|nr:acyltransferase [Gammaproteobacteria bacterium]